MLKLENVTKRFYQIRSEKTVVDSVSINVKQGEVYGFLGPNGAGKTTTVKMITGLLYPDSGSITINGLPSDSIEAKKAVGFMPEHPQFYQYLQSREVLEFVGQLFNMRQETNKRAEQLLEMVGLAQAIETPVRNFSKGMHQRLAFAVALMNDPALLILDEPLDGLDPIGRLDFKRLIQKWKKEGRTVFFSSHILSDVEELCDRIAILRDGRVIVEGVPAQLVKGKKQSLEEYFVEAIRDNQAPKAKRGKRS